MLLAWVFKLYTNADISFSRRKKFNAKSFYESSNIYITCKSPQRIAHFFPSPFDAWQFLYFSIFFCWHSGKSIEIVALCMKWIQKHSFVELKSFCRIRRHQKALREEEMRASFCSNSKTLEGDSDESFLAVLPLETFLLQTRIKFQLFSLLKIIFWLFSGESFQLQKKTFTRCWAAKVSYGARNDNTNVYCDIIALSYIRRHVPVDLCYMEINDDIFIKNLYH